MGTIVPPLQDPVQPPAKRIVFIATEGSCAGMHQICGLVAAKDIPRLSTFVERVEFPDGHANGASKIKETLRAVYYRELILPTSVKQTLAEGAKHGHFNPHQE